MNRFQLIALDIDGTLLDSRKNLPDACVRAIQEVTDAGKTVAFATGRALSEILEFEPLLPEIRYAVFSSGAGIYDFKEKKMVALTELVSETAATILDSVREKDVMPQIVLPRIDVIQKSHMQNLDHYHMGVYRQLYEHAMTLVPDIFDFFRLNKEPVLKINLYHADPDERRSTLEALHRLDIETVYSEISSIECSPRGVHKGSGLLNLCRFLGIDKAECIAVGDAENDISMIQAAGLGVAMGNANSRVKAAAQLVVSDNDHGGCAQAIRLLCERGAFA